jgi:hypothetical protein
MMIEGLLGEGHNEKKTRNRWKTGEKNAQLWVHARRANEGEIYKSLYRLFIICSSKNFS